MIFDSLLICVFCRFVDSQRCQWKIMNTVETKRNKERKKLPFENTILISWIFLETKHSQFSWPSKFLERLWKTTTYFLQALINQYQILSYLQLSLEAGSKLAHFWLVLFLLRNVLLWGYWYCAANQYSKITGFVKNFKEEYSY